MKTKTADWENRLNEILAEHMAIYGAEEGEGEYCRDLHDFIKSLLSSQKAEILDEVIEIIKYYKKKYLLFEEGLIADHIIDAINDSLKKGNHG